jgi:tetratricopeptide (TPR) repeat protein
MRFVVNFEKQNIRLGASRWLLSGQTRMRFEWLALLALRQKEEAGDLGWVSANEIARLPAWSGRSRHHIVTNVGRYLNWLDRREIKVVQAESGWAGPYRLNVRADAIVFDIPIEAASRRLGRQQFHAAPSREILHSFVFRYTRAESLFFQGKLAGIGGRSRGVKSAQGRLLAMLDDLSYGPRLRAIALLGAVQVLFQLGRLRFARETLERYRSLLTASRDNALIARYYLALAWSHQRESSGAAADKATLSALRNAARRLGHTTDREVAGMLAYRTSGFLTKHGRHEEAVAELIRAVEANLVIGNYHNVQAYCVDIGSDLHRLGPDSYREAHHWILVGLAICRWMKIGSDSAHGETILGKMYVEKRQPQIARFWLDRAVRVSEQAKNIVTLADAHMVMGLWHQAFGSDSETVGSLVEALRNFRSMPRFDCAQKEQYMARKFPEIWERVLATVGGTPLRKAVSDRSKKLGGGPQRKNVA